MISGLGWVSELIGTAGGIDMFPQLAAGKTAKDRIVSPEAGDRRPPDIIIGSWCGKKFVRAKASPPVRDLPQFPPSSTGWLREIKSR